MLFISSFYFVLWLIDITAAGLLGYLAAITLSKLTFTQHTSSHWENFMKWHVKPQTALCVLKARNTEIKHCVLSIFINCSSCNVDWDFGFSFFSQILDVNGQNFENVPLSKANEILKNNTHLSITVKTNLLGKLLWLKWPKLHRLSFRPNTKFQSALSPLQEGKM